MKHLTEKDLINFAKEKTLSSEKHLKECSSCLMSYNFLCMKLKIKSYVEFKRTRAKDTSIDCLSSELLHLYASGKILKDDKKLIDEHLFTCKKCADAFFSLDIENPNTLWQIIDETVSDTFGWIKGVFLVPDLISSRKTSTKKTVEKVFTGDEIKLEIPVTKNGYVTVLHWDGEKMSLIFPNLYDRDGYVKENTVKILKGKIDPPKGTHEIKIFLTEEKVLEPEELNFEDDDSLLKNIKAFIKCLNEIDDSKWSCDKKTYEVMEFLD